MRIVIIIIAVFIGVVGVPATINWIGTNISIKSGADFGDWLGFWGSYLGGFVTLAGVYLGFKLEGRKELNESIYVAGREINLIEEAMQEFLRVCKYGELSLSDVDTLRMNIQEVTKSKALHFKILLRISDIEKDLWNLRTPLDNTYFYNQKINEVKSHSPEQNEIKGENDLSVLEKLLKVSVEDAEKLKSDVKRKIDEFIVYIENNRKAP